MDDVALGILNKVKFLFYIIQFKYFKSKRANNKSYNVNDNIEKLTLYIDIAADFHKLYEAEYDETSQTYNNKFIEQFKEFIFMEEGIRV